MTLEESKREVSRGEFHEANRVIRSETTKFVGGKELGVGEGEKEGREGIHGCTRWQAP